MVSNQLIGIGHIIKSLALPEGAKILEMGAGWGNISLILSQMGYDVTVLDINPRYEEVIRHRSDYFNLNIKFKNIAFEQIDNLNERFDCVLFFESFHHSYDHQRLLEIIHNVLYIDKGILALAGEPVIEELPYDWGLNPAGEAIWQIRTHGWFELAFKESYLLKTLKIKGYETEIINNESNLIGKTFISRKK